MTNAARNIPAEVKREVRKKCGFGCAVCRLPFYEYAHVIPYSECKKHEIDNIVLLCSNHHAPESVGLVNIADYREFTDRPYNLRGEESVSLDLFLGGREPSIDIGKSQILVAHREIDQECDFLSIGGQRVITLRFQDSELRVDLALRNTKGTEVVSVEENRLSLGAEIADFDRTGSVVRVRSVDETELLIDFNRGNAIKLLSAAIPTPKGLLRILPEEGISVYFNDKKALTMGNMKFFPNGMPGESFAPSNAIRYGFLCIGDKPRPVPYAACFPGLG